MGKCPLLPPICAGAHDRPPRPSLCLLSFSCLSEDDDTRRLEAIRQKIARLNSDLEAKNLEILHQAACVPELRFYSRDLVRVLEFCHVQISRYRLMTDPMYSWIVNRCSGGGGDSPPGGPAVLSAPSPLFHFDRRGYGLDALNFYRQRIVALHARFGQRHEERRRSHEAAGRRFATDSAEARRRFIWRLEEYFSSPPSYRPPSPPPPSSNQRNCSELLLLLNVCEDSSSVTAETPMYPQ